MNPRIRILRKDVLSNNWYTLQKVTFEYLKKDGTWHTQSREAYDRGNGAAILLYNLETQTVILTRQFRLPTFINGNSTGMMIEACAGILETADPEACIKRETEEETGYMVTQVRKVFEAYMSPGSVTEILYFYVAAYSTDMKQKAGGGVADEGEEIEVMEIPFHTAFAMIRSGEIRDAKTIMLLQYAKLELFNS